MNMKCCENCKHKYGNEFTEPCRSCTDIDDKGRPVKWEPMTHADQLRSMTDEELAGWILRQVCCPDDRDGCRSSCTECWLEWLREEES